MRALIIFTSILIFTSSCMGDGETVSSENSTVSHFDIEKIEKLMFSKKENTTDSVKQIALSKYKEFALANPDDDMSANYLFRAANVARSLNKHTEAIDLCRKIVAEYPDFENVSASHFFIAFIYDNNLNDKKKAGEVYREVSELYPNEQFGKDAKMRLETMHMTDEELIKFFESKNKN